MSSAFTNIAIKAVYLAGNFMQQGSRNISNIKVYQKNPNDFVTDFDKKSEEIITKTILQAFPEHNILGEENGNLNIDSEYTWIIDPIDGTTNFIHGYPHYSISIALKQNDKIILGVVFEPNKNDLYRAEIGKGAYLNDKRIRVTHNQLENSIIGTGFPTYDLTILDQYCNIFKELTRKTSGQRRSGSAALDLAYVAAGYLDGFWEYNLKTWDVAAGVLLVREAGGMATDFTQKHHNGDSGNIIAANQKLLNQLQKIIQVHCSN